MNAPPGASILIIALLALALFDDLAGLFGGRQAFAVDGSHELAEFGNAYALDAACQGVDPTFAIHDHVIAPVAFGE